jgi:hypothetical protein
MLERGTIRIGTAEEYRIPDGMDGARSDKDELVTIYKPSKGRVHMPENHPFLRFFGFTNKSINMEFDEGVQFIMQSNAYIYSASYELTNNLRQRMASQLQADGCVKINNLPAFVAALNLTSLLKNLRHHMGYVSYEGKQVVEDYSGHDPLRKQPIFGWQKEVRLIWWGEKIPKSGEVINVPEIVPLLERVY